MALKFVKATRKGNKLRMALLGPSGSGKTYSALAIASNMGNGNPPRIAVVDTENRSASKYARSEDYPELFNFDVMTLDSYSPENYIQAIHEAEKAGYDILIIDSLSHAWSGKEGILEFVNNVQRKSKSQNSYVAWRDATPLHNKLVDAMINAKLHIIVTMRVKMEYSQEKDEHGKTVIRKVGLQPIQRDGMEYEFDIVGDIDLNNMLFISKTRCPELLDKSFVKAGAELAGIIMKWLEGVEEDTGPMVSEKPKTVRTRDLEDPSRRADFIEIGPDMQNKLEDLKDQIRLISRSKVKKEERVKILTWLAQDHGTNEMEELIDRLSKLPDIEMNEDATKTKVTTVKGDL